MIFAERSRCNAPFSACGRWSISFCTSPKPSFICHPERSEGAPAPCDTSGDSSIRLRLTQNDIRRGRRSPALSSAHPCHPERPQGVEGSPNHCNTLGDSSLSLRRTFFFAPLAAAAIRNPLRRGRVSRPVKSFCISPVGNSLCAVPSLSFRA